MNKNKLKNIEFRMTVDGRGIVNFDGDVQKYLKIKGISSTHDNVSYAKKNLYIEKDIDGVEFSSYKLKISNNSLRANMFKDVYEAHTPSVVHVPNSFYGFIATDHALIRGYLSTKGNISYKKKSFLNICDAEQICNAKSKMDTFSRSGYKDPANEGEVKADDEKKGTTYFMKETVGKIKYQTEGSLDLRQLELISCDTIFDRLAFDENDHEVFQNYLELGNTKTELGYYMLKGSSYQIPERALRLDEASRKRLLKKALEFILGYRDDKTSAYAKRDVLEVKMVNDVLEESEWITISSMKDIEELFEDVELFDFYEMVDVEESISLRETLDKEMKLDAKKSSAKSGKAKVTPKATTKKVTQKVVKKTAKQTTKTV